MVKVAFASGTRDLNPQLVDRLAAIYPELPLYVVSEFPPQRGEWIPYHPFRSWRDNMDACRAALAGKKIRLAAVLLVPNMPYRRMRLMALVLSVKGFLAYNENLDSFMLRPRSLPGIARHISWRIANFFRWHLRADNPWRVNPRKQWNLLLAELAGISFLLRRGKQKAAPPDADDGLGELHEAFRQVPGLFCATTQKTVWKLQQPTDFPFCCESPVPGENLSYVLYGSGECSLFDAAKLRALGGVNKMYEPGCVADLDLGYRAWLRGWPSVFVPGANGERCPSTTDSQRNYLKFASSTGSRKIWRDAITRGSEGAWKLPFTIPVSGVLSDEIFSLCSGNVAVFPGRAKRGLPLVLIATAYLPFPLAHGGAVRIFNLVSRAAAEFSQVMIAFCDELAAPPAELLAVCVEIVMVKRTGTHYRRASGRPDMVDELDVLAYRAAIKQMVNKWKPAIAQLEFTPMAQYAPDCRPAKTILVEHDITFDLHEQLARTNPSWEAHRELELWRNFEKKLWPQMDRVVTMSAKDAKTVGLPTARSLPNGVDLSRFVPMPGLEEPGRVLFIGSFTHLPNVLALEFFLAEVWPKLADLHPTLHVIAGARHQYYLDFHRKQIEAPRMELEGFVSDVRQAYARASVVIAPLTASAGTNIKILEAMAMGKAIVSTPAGINGLDVAEGVLVREDAEEFANALRTCLTDAVERERLARSAREIVERDYGWDEIGKKQRALYEELLNESLQDRVGR